MHYLRHGVERAAHQNHIVGLSLLPRRLPRGFNALPGAAALQMRHQFISGRAARAVERRAVPAVDLRRQRGSNTWQLFSFDPNGARVELDFAADEEP